MKRRLGIAVAMMHDPALLLLDEPTASLDAASRDKLFRDLYELRDLGHAILLTTHHAEDAEGCDRALMLDAGRLAATERVGFSKSALLYGHLRELLPQFIVRGLQERLEESGVDLEITGRRVSALRVEQ